jgi:hypothetical protein
VVTLFGAMLGAKNDTVRLIDELVVRAGADPIAASLEQLPSAAAKRYLTAHAPGVVEQPAAAPVDGAAQPALVFNKSEFFQTTLPADAIEALINLFSSHTMPGQARELDFTPWGGAYNRVQPQATAFVHRSENFILKHAVSLDANLSRRECDAGRDWLARSWALAHPYGSGGLFPNFADPEVDDWSTAYHGGNRDRLLRIKAKYDPDNIFDSDRIATG